MTALNRLAMLTRDDAPERHAPAEPYGHQPRQDVRLAAHGSVTITSWSDEPIQCRLSNITLHGCNLTPELGSFRIGQIIAIKLTEHVTAGGIVRWVRAGRAGIEFLRPISPALVEMYQR